MSSQAKINVYMERHRIGPLFEDLMNRVLRDMPEEPLIYMLRTMYKKAGMEIPQSIRYGGLRKSVDLARGSSPERPSRSAQVSSSADVAGTRDYDRPWATSPTRRTKPKKPEEVRKSKPEWNADNKTKHLSSFDEFWEVAEAGATRKERTTASASGLRKSKQDLSPAANAWASVGLEDNEERYMSPPYHGPGGAQKRTSTRMTEEELLAAEMLSSSRRSQGQENKTPEPELSGIASCSARDRKGELKKHRRKLGAMLTNTDKNDSGLGPDLDPWGDDNDDDAIEMLEEADDLRREGVVNIPKSGYKLSRNLRHRENAPQVKLNINLNPGSFNSWQDAPRHFESFDTPRSSPEQKEQEEDEEEEFESVSQVTGPRHPVWKLPGTQDLKAGTSIPLRPAFSSDDPSQHSKRHGDKHLYATTPVSAMDRSVKDADELSATAKTWTEGENRVSFDDSPEDPPTARSIQSATSSGGWHIPDDTDLGSGYDWNQRVKGGPPRDPRAY